MKHLIIIGARGYGREIYGMINRTRHDERHGYRMVIGLILLVR